MLDLRDSPCRGGGLDGKNRQKGMKLSLGELLTVAGGDPPDAVANLAGGNIEVEGSNGADGAFRADRQRECQTRIGTEECDQPEQRVEVSALGGGALLAAILHEVARREGRAFDPLLDLAEIGQRHLFPVGVREITTQGEPTGLLPVEQQPRPTALSEHVALQLTDVV